MTSLTEDHGVTVIVRRRTKPGCERDFETAMRDFVAFALASPGNRGIYVLRSAESNPREYTVVDCFANPATRKAFTASELYKEWMVRLRALTEDDPYIDEAGGTSGWFTLPGKPHAIAPRWKMALVTFLGVYPLTSFLPPFVRPLLHEWHPLMINVVVTGIIVASLTWVIMPNLTQLFRRWLFPAAANSAASPRPISTNSFSQRLER